MASPDHPKKLEPPPPGVAVKVTVEFSAKLPVVLPAAVSIVAGVDTTVPVAPPVRLFVAVRLFDATPPVIVALKSNVVP